MQAAKYPNHQRDNQHKAEHAAQSAPSIARAVQLLN